MRKKYFVKPQDVLESHPNVVGSHQRLQGFDIPINEDSVKRIDRLVNEYEKHIMAPLNDEYLRKTTWAHPTR